MRRALLPSLLLLLGALFAACIGEDRYVYSARHYQPDADCLEPYAPVETVPGEGASSRCPASCLSAGGALYVTEMCAPLPAIATAVSETAAECRVALAALEAGRTCDAARPAEGGADADAGAEDSGEDAGRSDAAEAGAVRDAAEAG